MSYYCKNVKKEGYDWICFCPENNKTAKETISQLYNGWIVEHIKYVQSKLPKLSEEDAVEEIFNLEEEANGRMEMWKWSC
jgi:hypothetical protein